MSEYDETSLDTGYSTPVPELDDHRHQSASVQKPHSRRGTFDSQHGISPHGLTPGNITFVDRSLLLPVARDFEEAIVDEESREHSPIPHRHAENRSRRGTVTTLDPRSASPPNSVKAFADARRRERELSIAEPSTVKAFAEARRLQEDCDLHRTISGGSRRSRRSLRSRRYTNDNDAHSIAASNKSAEEDVCFPLHSTPNKDTLQIDFNTLEEFIAEEESRDKTPPKNQPQARVFNDLRPKSRSQYSNIVTSDGNLVEIPSESSSSLNEKDPQDGIASTNNFNLRVQDAAHVAPNRFEFFSSRAESTIHAAEFGDLILPGEDIRSLFTFPPDEEEDGVWWLNLNNPTEEEIRAICKAFGVHPLTIEDIGTQEAREKIELFPSYYFACFRSFHAQEIDDGQEYEPFNIYVVVFREGTLSFSFSPNPHAGQVRKRITMLKDYVALSSDWICYALMYVSSSVLYSTTQLTSRQ